MYVADKKIGGLTILRRIQNEINELEKKLLFAQKEVGRLPAGTLRCTSCKGTEQFYIDGHYISKKKYEMIKGVAQREYLENMIPLLEERIRMLYDLRENYNSHALESVCCMGSTARKKLIYPLWESIEQKINNFFAEEYEAGTFEEENTTEFFTTKGERVRSKSELLIAEHLNRYDVPYRYEKPLKLKLQNRIIVCRPDFTVLNKTTAKLYIYEHLGRMDDIEYVIKNMRKLDLYEKNGFLLGKNLIITHETSTSPLNTSVVDSYIESFFI